MSIPNVSTLASRIRAGAEGGLEFGRICSQLLQFEFNTASHGSWDGVDDRCGDHAGCDGRYRSWDAAEVGQPAQSICFSFKFFASPLSSDHKRQVRSSLVAALQHKHTKWILVTPDDFNRHEQSWFEKLVEGIDDSEGPPPILEHWGHTRLVGLMLKHTHVGRHYFPELFESGGAFVVDRVTVDDRWCAWSASDDGTGAYADEGTFEIFYGDAMPDELLDFASLPHATQAAFRAGLAFLLGQVGKLKLRGMEKEAGWLCSLNAGTLYLTVRDGTLLYQGHDAWNSSMDLAYETLGRIMGCCWPTAASFLSETGAHASDKSHPIAQFHHLVGRGKDPVLDLLFTNHGSSTATIVSVHLNVRDVTQSLGGGAAGAYVVPVVSDATIEVVAGMKSIRSDLRDPIAVPPGSSGRIRVHLTNYSTVYGPPMGCALSIDLECSDGSRTSTTTLSLWA